MKILQGKQASNFEEAAALAFHEAGIADISADIIGMFSVLRMPTESVARLTN